MKHPPTHTASAVTGFCETVSHFHTSQSTGINGLCKHGVIILNAFLKCSLYLECCVTLLDVVAFGVHERIHSGLGGVSEDWGAQMKGLLLPGVAAEDKCELKSTSRPICVGGFISFEANDESPAPPSLCVQASCPSGAPST